MRVQMVAWIFMVGACGSPADEVLTDDTAVDTDTVVAFTGVGHCLYTNTFSDGPECKEFLGDGWTAEDAADSCTTGSLAASAGTFVADEPCATEAILGRCKVGEGTDEAYDLVFPGTDEGACSGVQLGCTFASGVFEPAGPCEDGGGTGSGGTVFVPFEQECIPPVNDEGAGDGPDGDVCTWGAISACTEEGRRYEDYASCDTVFTQRPYAPYAVSADTELDDPRLSDTTWQAEYAWVTEQVEACACICCHSSELAPEGPSGWYLEAEPIWVDTLDDDGLAMLAGWVDSTAFGAFEPADNNGFSRDQTGLPTTDVQRMTAFLEGELARRGFEKGDFADTEPFGGPLYDQLFYEPGPCGSTDGIAQDGTISWRGGGARYVYVLAKDSASPGVPPNLDTPAGTIWRLDVAPEDPPLETGIRYGTVPAGARQAFPASGAPAALQSGTVYYLVALKDIYQPVTRCTFTAK